ncbi:son of sevenless homolog 1-like [Paramacrobiotus metropolitanus]|uniref:son of sevenless homolog 1-like n=1 Tax=Paramacrobiotus metropolitanus TaxID=2943436 RepID=UPI00244601AC|nr:son of sevenless homolog 1-like [Paramacrobiotus metropolitanus]
MKLTMPLDSLSPKAPMSPNAIVLPLNGRSGSVVDTDRNKWLQSWHAPLRELLSNYPVNKDGICRATPEALMFISDRLDFLLQLLSAGQPSKVADLEHRAEKIFPDLKEGIDSSVLKKDKKARKTWKGFPGEDVRVAVQKRYFPDDKEFLLTSFACAVLETIAQETFRRVVHYLVKLGRAEVRTEDIKVTTAISQSLTQLFGLQDEEMSSLLTSDERPVIKTDLTYDDIVKDLIQDERAYARELRMIIKVFQDVFARYNLECEETGRERDRITDEELKAIFLKVDEALETSLNFLSLLEDTVEMDGQSGTFNVWGAFEEMAEAGEFGGMEDYAKRLLDAPHQWGGAESSSQLTCDGAIKEVLARKPTMEYFFKVIGGWFVDAVRYVLPRLLVSPVARISQYYDCCEALRTKQNDEEANGGDAEPIVDALGILEPISDNTKRLLLLPHNTLKARWVTQYLARSRSNRQSMLERVQDVFKSVEGLDMKDCTQLRMELIYEGDVWKWRNGGRTDRRMYLFDSCAVLCKPKPQKKPGLALPDYNLKERIPISRLQVIPLEDSGDMRFAIELRSGDHREPEVILCMKTCEEREMWLSCFYGLLLKSPLEKKLEKALEDEDKEHPLRLPLPEFYPFSEPDGPDNIVFEESSPVDGIPCIKGATLHKLIERLTYHLYFDHNFVRTFLITFRSFTEPARLLDLLIERFNIPQPADDNAAPLTGFSSILSKKRFQKEYCQPVQFRVLNVMRQWVDNHFLDFENDPRILKRLREFLKNDCQNFQRHQTGRKKIIDSIDKILKRRECKKDSPREYVFPTAPPDIEHHLDTDEYGINLMTLHPTEVARQLTLMEFEIYRSIKPSELVQWNSRKNKDGSSPNLEKLIQLSTRITLYFVKYILMTENLEERVAVMARIIEIMQECLNLNNFSSVVEILSAFSNSSIHRLNCTKSKLSPKYNKILEGADKLSVSENHGKAFFERLRSIDPPCIPFMGIYLTQLLHAEEGNTNFIASRDQTVFHEQLINFNKRRKIADIVAGNLQYQNQPYCRRLEPHIMEYLEKLDPYEDVGQISEKELVDFLYNQSQKIEPRNCETPPFFPKRFNFPLAPPKRRPGNLPTQKGMSQATSTMSIQSFATSPMGLRTVEDKSETPSAASSPATPTTPHSFDMANGSGLNCNTLTRPPGGDQEAPPVPPRTIKSQMSQVPVTASSTDSRSPRSQPTPFSHLHSFLAGNTSPRYVPQHFTFDTPPQLPPKTAPPYGSMPQITTDGPFDEPPLEEAPPLPPRAHHHPDTSPPGPPPPLPEKTRRSLNPPFNQQRKHSQ